MTFRWQPAVKFVMPDGLKLVGKNPVQHRFYKLTAAAALNPRT